MAEPKRVAEPVPLGFVVRPAVALAMPWIYACAIWFIRHPDHRQVHGEGISRARGRRRHRRLAVEPRSRRCLGGECPLPPGALRGRSRCLGASAVHASITTCGRAPLRREHRLAAVGRRARARPVLLDVAIPSRGTFSMLGLGSGKPRACQGTMRLQREHERRSSRQSAPVRPLADPAA